MYTWRRRNSSNGNVWVQRFVVEVLQRAPVVRQIYQGEDGVMDIDGFEELCEPQPDTKESERPKSPVVAISPEKYHSLFQPWQGAYILMLLGKIVSLKIMEQRTRDLWKLEWGNQLIDLENGYFLARFYKKEDYFHVLEGCPWIVMGHYLTVAKWKPNFRPSVGNVQSTMVWV